MTLAAKQDTLSSALARLIKRLERIAKSAPAGVRADIGAALMDFALDLEKDPT